MLLTYYVMNTVFYWVQKIKVNFFPFLKFNLKELLLYLVFLANLLNKAHYNCTKILCT